MVVFSCIVNDVHNGFVCTALTNMLEYKGMCKLFAVDGYDIATE